MLETYGYLWQRWSTTIYEDNSVSFNWKDDVEIQKIRSCENLASLFIKYFPRITFEQLVHMIGLFHLNHVSLHEEKYKEQYYIEWCTLFLSLGFVPKGFFLVRF